MSQLPRRLPIPTPLPVGDVNTYYLPGRRPTLIDAGPRTPEATRALHDAVDALPIEVVVITHQHADHAGLARTLQRERGARVLVHEGDAPALRGWKAHAAARENDYAVGLEAAGVPESERERMRYGGRKYDEWGDPVEPDDVLQGDQALRLGDQEWRIVDAPGHTPGSFLLHSAELQATVSGDTLLEHITPNAVSVRYSERGALATYLETLRKLVEGNWGTVLPGHGRTFRDAGSVIRRALVHAERRQARILKSLDGADSTAFEVVGRLFPRLPQNQLFLAVSEVLGHLECLRQAGRLTVAHRAGVDRYACDEQG